MSPGLVLFFTRGVSLKTWAMMGMLEREIALYKRLMKSGFSVSFVTYGGAEDLNYSNMLGGIDVLCNQAALPLEEYEEKLFSLHARTLNQCSIIKTNQMYGAELALEAARYFGKPLVARCGYMWSNNAAREAGYHSPQAILARRIEEKVFKAAQRIFVTTEAMRKDVTERVPSAASRIHIVPNYVDTDIFKPLNLQRDANTLLFVGRIAPEKNLYSLLEAIRELEVKLILIGEGKLRPVLQDSYASNGRTIWEGTVPNSRLPEYMNRATIFVLPSLYEGHPKVLLEAMACGAAVIGARSPGIMELIRHSETGYLSGTDPKSLKRAVRELLDLPELRTSMGKNARSYVLENYSLDKIAAMESALLREVIGE